jgi:hypothetical protein
MGQDSGSAASTTKAAISGVAGNKAARTGDAETGIQQIFDASKTRDEVGAQVAITSEFGKQASKAVGDYAATKLAPIDNANTYKYLKGKTEPLSEIEQKALARMEAGGYTLDSANAALADPQNKVAYENWKEGGTYRVALHTVVGGLGGGVGGAAGAATSQTLVPKLGEELAKLDIPLELKNTLIQVAGMTIGAATGGTGGAVAGQNATANNYLKHPEIMGLIKAKNDCQGGKGSASACAEVTRLEKLDKQRDNDLQAACQNPTNPACAPAQQEVRSAYAQTLRAYVRGDLKDLSTKERLTYIGNQTHTEFMANTTLSTKDYAGSGLYTTGASALQGLADMAKGIATFGKAALGNEDARDKVGATTAALAKLLSQPENWGALLERATDAQALKLADAYEKGDTKALGAMAGEVAASIVDPVAVFKGAKLSVKAAEGLQEFVVARKASNKADDAAAMATNEARINNNVNAETPGFGTAAQREFQPGTTHRAENINAGQVTDRDGLPRIDEAKRLNDAQVAENLNLKNAPYYGTARPAWKEGTAATDRIVTQPETYRMVVNESEYEAIRTLVKTGDPLAAQKLGGWATKDAVNTAADVRNNLAISSEWKGKSGEAMYVIEFKAKPGVGVREGTVGPMFDADVKATLPGGGHQVQFLDKSPRTNPELYEINLSNSKRLK